MENTKAKIQTVVPFITLFAEPRRESLPLPGTYDEKLKLTVFNKSGEKVPLISAYASPEILTKTEADKESDEDNQYSIILETMTKTAIQRESDDPDRSYPLDLFTKTFAERESDEDEKLLFLELFTKTKIEREGDDNHFDI